MLRFVANLSNFSKNRQKRKALRNCGLKYQNLEPKQLLASIAFNPSNGIVTLTGDATADTATVSELFSGSVTFTLTGATPLTLSLIHI